MATKSTQLLDYKGISERTGISLPGLRSRMGRGSLPEPDYVVGQSPAWLPATIEAWIASEDYNGPRHFTSLPGKAGQATSAA